MTKEYNKLAVLRAIEMSEDEIEHRLCLKEDIDELQKSIESIESYDSINNYLLDSAQILFHYYDDSTLQNSSSSSSSSNYVSTMGNKSKKKKNVISSSVSILDLFTRSAKKSKQKNQKKEETCVSSQPPQSEPDENEQKSPKFTKNRIINEYKRIIEKNFVDDMDEYNQDMDYCGNCNVERIFYRSEGIMVCPECGTIEKMLSDSDKPSYKEPPREISYFAYKRINHFNESIRIYANYFLLMNMLGYNEIYS